MKASQIDKHLDNWVELDTSLLRSVSYVESNTVSAWEYNLLVDKYNALKFKASRLCNVWGKISPIVKFLCSVWLVRVLKSKWTKAIAIATAALDAACEINEQ